jgi:hypothetical protein
MKRLLLITSAVGLCLAAPAFAQSTPEQDQLNRQKAAPPSSAAPAAQSQDRQRPNQPPMDRGGQAQQRPAAGSPSPSAQAPASQDQRGQAQNQQQPPSGAPASSAQAPAPTGQAQSPAADQTQRGQAQNQRDPAADRTKAQAPADQPQQRSATDRNQPAQSGQAPADQQQQRSATDRNQPAQSGQAPADRQQQRSATDRNQPAQGGQADRRQSQQDMQRQDRRQDAQTSRSQTSTRDRASTSLNVDINETQRTRIASAISSVNVRPVNVNFRVATGVVVPRTVTLHTLPPTIVEVVPQFRGYSYFVTREQIVIVEPRRKTIVAVLPAGDTARAQAPAASRASFTEQHREVIRSRASSLRSPATTGSSVSRIVVEQEVPATIELEEFPVEIVTEVPVVRSYRYFVQDNDVFVVDPVERRVIEIIR